MLVLDENDQEVVCDCLEIFLQALADLDKESGENC
jgi:hypothetical protein